MRFADLKNDFLFRKVFAHHPDLTTALLNDLLGFEGASQIVQLTILQPEQAPDIPGLKVSILDVKCRDQAGRWFVVEMQMVHLAGFLNRVVFNACKAFVSQLARGRHFGDLAPVVALSICDFEIWPDAPRIEAGLTPVPLVSHWAQQERASGAVDLQQIQYSFVELPKVPLAGTLSGVAERWAWLFRVGSFEGDIPIEATPAQQQALQLANESTWTAGEHQAYERVQDEIEQARELAIEKLTEGRREGKADGLRIGKADGLLEGEAIGLRAAVTTVCELLGIPLDADRTAHLMALDAGALTALLGGIKRDRRWPS